MGEVIKFTGKRLSGFLPDDGESKLPEPFADNLKETRSELAGLVLPAIKPEGEDILYSAPPDDCA